MRNSASASLRYLAGRSQTFSSTVVRDPGYRHAPASLLEAPGAAPLKAETKRSVFREIRRGDGVVGPWSG
jgi:hypothetical protein